MADALLQLFRRSLPEEIAQLVSPHIHKLEQGQYEDLLQDADAQALFGHLENAKTNNIKPHDFPSWNDYIFHSLGSLTADRTKPENQAVFFCIGYAALLAFLQSNVTGPPLSFNVANVILPKDVSADKHKTSHLRKTLLQGLGIDGIAAYKLTPNIELLCLADAIMTAPAILKNIKGARWAKMRILFLQQRLLSEVSSTLQNMIYDELDMLADKILVGEDSSFDVDAKAEFLLERATIHIHHGLDKFARADLEQAKSLRQFEFALTGLLGKRTKFQIKETSQLVVLARSATSGSKGEVVVPAATEASDVAKSKPQNLDLNDDTLLESISFSKETSESAELKTEESLPPSLSSLDPSDQPQLDPLDSTTLLQFASSIKNTSPEDGLTREETLPYATRVLEGGSSNWQVYTQALLVRSRIEGYRSRTVERGLLQLQALVDQVIADTTGQSSSFSGDTTAESNASFLPRAKESESAPAPERLRYIFQLASQTRWDLEAELAARWVQLGGLRSALDIYERLEMWAEAALCWAATERDDKARRIVRRQLFHRTGGDTTLLDNDAPDDEDWEGPDRDPPPPDAPRLYCILGDIDSAPAMYEKAWVVSNQRYARAQRSLGRHYFSTGDFLNAAKAYSLSLKANQLNHPSWFAMGCALLALNEFERAAEAFSRCVQLDDTDGESWSNLAAALLRMKPKENGDISSSVRIHDDDEEDDSVPEPSKRNPQQHKLDALKALKRAAALKHDNYRIWENVLIVSAGVSPPDLNSAMTAQRRIIQLRGGTDGEKCIDKEILHLMAQHAIASSETFNPEHPGFARMFVQFVDQSVVPLITASADLWRLVGKLALWRNKPASALDAEEKAWRAVTSQPGWEHKDEAKWNEIVEATVRLCDSYESLGPKERTEGLGAGEVVMKDWRFKARSAVRTVQGRGKSTWDGTEGWERLREVAEGLKG